MISKTKIAIICANGLGDALVQMVLANNLARQDLTVTFFSDIAASLDKHVQNYTIEPFPDYDDLLSRLKSFDLSLYDSSGLYVRNMPEEIEAWCVSNAVCYRMSDAAPRHTNISVEKLSAKLPVSCAVSAQQFKSLNASLRGKFKTLYRPPVVKQLTDYLDQKVVLGGVINGNGLSTGVVKKDNQKIIIHPTSSNIKKNWPIQNYLELVRELQQLGYTPCITVSPAEREEWLDHVSHARLGTTCEVPQFDTISALAEFYANAYCFIGNDSGNAHLASSLGVPTIQLFSGWKTSPAWRAGWGKNKVVTAKFPYNLIKKQWFKGVSVFTVLKSFREFAKVNFES